MNRPGPSPFARRAPDTLGPRSCSTLVHHRPPYAISWRGAIGQHRHLAASDVREPQAPSALSMCGSIGPHRHHGASSVREPRATSAPQCVRCARASSSIGTFPVSDT
ncbi:hypothetical protein J1N35_046172 [Gossypium stocksii]|uniref:Uncharacterized protein n=1 Tax=Gossypium stocksii TaxID=47602 RepID=A0A9D3ZEH5_9ROSI|nr:hypothetical protein J1N35_046172 [Gossypium stocksii]